MSHQAKGSLWMLSAILMGVVLQVLYKTVGTPWQVSTTTFLAYGVFAFVIGFRHYLAHDRLTR